MGWVSWPQHLFVFLASFSALWCQIFGQKWGFWNFLKKLLAQFISYLAFILMEWVSWSLCIFVFLASFSARWWPNIWPKMGFPELFEKTIGSIHFIFILMGWVFWPQHLSVFLASFSALWWTNICVIMALDCIFLCFLYRFCRLVANFDISQTFYINCCDSLNTITL